GSNVSAASYSTTKRFSPSRRTRRQPVTGWGAEAAGSPSGGATLTCWLRLPASLCRGRAGRKPLSLPASRAAILPEQALHLIEDVGGDDFGAEVGINLLRAGTPFGLLLRSEFVNGQSALFHRGHRVIAFLAAVGADFFAGLGGRLQHSFTRLGGNFFPGLLFDDAGADQRRPVEVQHVRGPRVDLRGQRKDRRGGHGIDQTGLQ